MSWGLTENFRDYLHLVLSDFQLWLLDLLVPGSANHLEVEWSRQKNKFNRPTLFCALPPSHK